MKRSLALLLAVVAALFLTGCPVVLIGGAAAGTAMVATDRRLTDVQIADERIEITAGKRIGDAVKGDTHVNVTSFNRMVLLTGEVPSEAAKAEAERVTAGVTEVRGVFNELTVGPPTSWGTRSADSYITSQVKARMVTAKVVNPMHVKVVTENGVVYLMGLVTGPEGAEATQIARTTRDVKRVVRLFEPWPPPASAPAPSLNAPPASAPAVAPPGVTPVAPPPPVEQRALPPTPPASTAPK
jgi:osmotically-inducible protein OsmY